MLSRSVVSDSVRPWTMAHQTPLSLGILQQEYWSGLPFPSPEDLPNSGIEPKSPSLQRDWRILYCLSHQGFVTNFPLIWKFNTTNIYLTVSVDQKSGHVLAGCLGFKVSHSVAIKVVSPRVTQKKAPPFWERKGSCPSSSFRMYFLEPLLGSSWGELLF